jgi:hypothetical protein
LRYAPVYNLQELLVALDLLEEFFCVEVSEWNLIDELTVEVAELESFW